MQVPTFDIFYGSPRNKQAIWLETVEGLGMAYELMKEIAAQSPGHYFIFDRRTHTILGSTNTLDSNVERSGAA